VDVSAEEFVKKAIELKPDIVRLSALLTTTMSSMKTTLDARRAENIMKTSNPKKI
jgi:5-methyltetrahydrofolate--homocysteine methyltransferase